LLAVPVVRKLIPPARDKWIVGYYFELTINLAEELSRMKITEVQCNHNRAPDIDGVDLAWLI